MVLSDWPDLRRPAFKTNFPSYLKKKLPHCSEKNFCSQGSQVASFGGRKRHLFVKDCPGEMCWHKARQMTKLDLSYKSLSDILQPPTPTPPLLWWSVAGTDIDLVMIFSFAIFTISYQWCVNNWTFVDTNFLRETKIGATRSSCNLQNAVELQ